MADWYYAKAGKQFGPISSAQLKQMAQSGELMPDDLVFQEGGTQWVAASTVKGLFGGGSIGTSAPPSRGTSRNDNDRGGGYPADDRDKYASGAQPSRPSEPPGEQGKYWMDVLFFRRLIAPTIIMILFWINVGIVVISSLGTMLMGLVALFSGEVTGLLFILLGILYESLMSINENLERNKKDSEALR
jgi:hypothetical protein